MKKNGKLSRWVDPFASLHKFTTAMLIPADMQLMKIVSQRHIYVRGRMTVGEDIPFVDILANKKRIRPTKLPTLNEVGLVSGCSLFVPKIPHTLIAEVEQFFRDVYRDHQSEAVVLLLHSVKGDWHVVTPTQEVGGGFADYVWPDKAPPRGWFYVGTIHSHAGFSAFHSGVDDGDEFDFDGIHITLGGVTQGGRDIYNRSASASVMIGGVRFLVPMSSLIEEPDHIPYEGYWMEQVEKVRYAKPVYYPTTSKAPVNKVFSGKVNKTPATPVAKV